jgi:hypothetical protein
MFSRHVTKDISAYCHGELSEQDSKKFAEHIISCVKCRAKFEEVKLGIKLAEQLPTLSAPEHLWRDLADLLDGKNEALAQVLANRTANRRPVLAYAASAAAVLIAAIGFAWVYSNRPSPMLPAAPSISLTARPSWRVNRLDGTPKIGREKIYDDGELKIGQVLETDGSSRARIAVGSIGYVDIDQNTRIKLLSTELTEHRLELARGSMSARIWAPPRLFFVDTPSGVAADMGCAYTLDVDDFGNGFLRVTSGWVVLQLKDRESIVPAGAVSETRKGIGPGTPYFVDATPAFHEAVKTLDVSDIPPMRSYALSILLDQARPRDTLTLWHLLPRVNAEERGRLYDKLALLAPPPADVSRDGILQLDAQMLETWKQALQPGWIGSGKVLWKKNLFGNVKGGLSERLKDMAPK